MTVTTQQVVEVKLSPQMKTRLLKRLKVYAELKTQADALKAAMAKLNTEIETTFLDADQFGALQSGVRLDGFSLKHVAPLRKQFDGKKFVELGGDLAILAEASPLRPTKAYMRIVCPGDREHNDE